MELISYMQSNVLWFKGLEITTSVTLEQPNQGQRKAKPSPEKQILSVTHLSLSTVLKENNLKCSLQPFGPMMTETSKCTGWKAGQCSALGTNNYKISAAGAGTCVSSMLQPGWRDRLTNMQLPSCSTRSKVDTSLSSASCSTTRQSWGWKYRRI